jgi:endonuclease/exonuclease/phosphatase family metal-dependent hydrolase
LQPDLALLQEVSGIPRDVEQSFDIRVHNAVTESGKPQKFGTAVLVKGAIVQQLPLSSEYDWVNQELDRLKGNVVCYSVQTAEHSKLNVVSVHSPAWAIKVSEYPIADVKAVQLIHNPRVWATEVLWSALKKADLVDAPWIVGGDFNSSETFDREWQDSNGVRPGLRSSGNREILERMKALGFTECLRGYNGKLTPTFRNPANGRVVHQMDHLFATNPLYLLLNHCAVGDGSNIFTNSVSDHLPIVADFRYS